MSRIKFHHIPSISDRIASNAIEWDEKESVRTDILEFLRVNNIP